MRQKRLAQEYRELTGTPLGNTGEVAEYAAAQNLRVKRAPARHAGYDASDESTQRTYQIKGRCMLPGCIYEAEREAVIQALTKPGSRARN